MDRCGGSRKSSNLDIEYDYQAGQECRVLARESVDEGEPKLRQGSTKCGKRVIDSLACSPHRLQDDGNDGCESTTRVPVVTPNAPANQLSPRQRKLDAAIDRVTTIRESNPRHVGEDAASPSWKIHPMYCHHKPKDEVRPPRKIRPVHYDVSTALCSIPEGIFREKISVDAERSQTALQKESTIAALYIPLKGEKEDISTAQGGGIRPPVRSDRYNDIEHLIARVERLDALCKSEEITAVASFDGEVEPSGSNAKKGIDRSSNFVPIDRPLRDSSDKNARSHEKNIAVPTVKGFVDGSHDFQVIYRRRPVDRSLRDSSDKNARSHEKNIAVPTVKGFVDGSHDFKVIYRRRPGSPGSTRETTAASSVASMSSFGIPTSNNFRKLNPISSALSRKSRSDKQATAHPFFWRTHPRGTFTSYGPNLPKKMLSPLRHEPSTNQHMKIRPRKVTTSFPLVAPSPRMKTVEEEEGNAKDGEAQGSASKSPSWSKDTDPDAERSQDYERLTRLTPPREQPRFPGRRESITQKREKTEEIQAPGTKNGSKVFFPEIDFSTSWTGT